MKQVPKKKPIKSSNAKPRKEKWSFSVRYPLLWIALAVFAVYFKTASMDYIYFDDTAFIVENTQFNSELKNVVTAFNIGLFPNTNNVYYRPVFLVDMILETQLFGTHPQGYHMTNILFHLLSVILLFKFLCKLKIPEPDAFILSLLFAVHPVLSQALAWIPGRNDMLLMIFILSGLLVLFKYLESENPVFLFVYFFLFLISLFTKESAVLIPLITIVLLWFWQKSEAKKIFYLAFLWSAALVVWYLMRAHAIEGRQGSPVGELINAGVARGPAIIQYLGKIIFPVDLSVYPIMRDTSLVWGLLAVVVVTGVIILSKSYHKPLTWIGLLWFLLFISPVLIVPFTINDNVFEHRLYIPIAGILILLGKTRLFPEKSWEPRRLVIFGLVILTFGIMSFTRVDYFRDRLTYWTRAMKDSPHSAHAYNQVTSLTGYTSEMERAKVLWKIHSMEPGYHGINLELGKFCLDHEYNKLAKKYLLAELANFQPLDLYFQLARVYFIENIPDSSAFYLEKVLKLYPAHPEANRNLALLYLQQGRKDKARKILENMKTNGLEVPADLLERSK
jgi:hypothetical protein